ncbi:class I SAM-dependent methyltransferase [Chloroflexota bacterium]
MNKLKLWLSIVIVLLRDVWLALRLLSKRESFMVKISSPNSGKVKKMGITDHIKLLAPWFHDIPIPGYNTSTFELCGVAHNVVTHMPQVIGYPSDIFTKLQLSNIRGRNILEIGPASGYYTLSFLAQNNRVTIIERAERFIAQIKYLTESRNLKNIKILQGEFPGVMPNDKFDIVFCLGVLYHTYDYRNFLDALFSIPCDLWYLETLISKTGNTTTEGVKEGWMFSKEDFSGILQEYGMKTLKVLDICGVSNLNYEGLSHYRSIYTLKKGHSAANI